MTNEMTVSNESPSGVKSGFGFYRKLGLLYLLNLIDWICTEVLLGSGKFVEANPLMQPVLSGFTSTLLLKGALPLVLVALCALLYKLSGEHENRFANILLNIGIVAYSLVNLWHIFNFILLFSSI